MTIRVGINGFGRIGRLVFRVLEARDSVEVVAINDLADTATMATLLRYDSVHGRFQGAVEAIDEKSICVNGNVVHTTTERDPRALPWEELGVDFVVESTGVFRRRQQLAQHLEAGAAKVLLTVPAKSDIDAMIVMGVNEHELDADHRIISNASCTTNCLAPLAKVIHDEFGIRHGLVTTTHGYTNGQRLLDSVHKDLRRARSAAVNIIPTTTSAASAVGKVLPQLHGRLAGMALSVPVPNGFCVDLCAELARDVTIEEVNSAIRAASESTMLGILEYCEDPLVSSDIRGNPHSCIVDAMSTMVMNGNLVKLLAWYDNEWGYSNRVADLLVKAHELGGAPPPAVAAALEAQSTKPAGEPESTSQSAQRKARELTERARRRIETVAFGGSGGEANVYLQLRNWFPGPGGAFQTEEDFVVACRVPGTQSGKDLLGNLCAAAPLDLTNVNVRRALGNFLVHTMLKILDTYFFRCGKYRYAHIPRVLGITLDGCMLYEWVPGDDAVPMDWPEGPEGDFRKVPVLIEEESLASNAFSAAGIQIMHDTVCVDDHSRQNLVVEEPDYSPGIGISRLWKRIDLSVPNSLEVDYFKLRDYLAENREAMEEHLSEDRVRLFELANEYQLRCASPRSFEDYEELMLLLLDFRKAAAESMGCEGGSPRNREREIKLIDREEGKRIRRKRPPKQLRTSKHSVLLREIRSSLPCIRGAIHTRQDMLVARITRYRDADPDIGLNLFLRHFLIKKLETYFIKTGRYTFSHIPRPLGYRLDGCCYWYEWVYGSERVPRSFVLDPQSFKPGQGLAEWWEFVDAFWSAGVDMVSGLRFLPSTNRYSDEVVAKQIIVGEPVGRKEPDYISRMWKRVNFHQRSVRINLPMLKRFLLSNREELERVLFKEPHAIGRYQTILLAVEHLMLQDGVHLGSKKSAALFNGVLNYCLSALSHLDNRGFEEAPKEYRLIKVEKDTLRYPGAA